MTQRVYDKVIDMTESSVFHMGYWDNEDKIIYLVFNNGTPVSRVLPGYTTDDIDNVRSWGQWWNFEAKHKAAGPEIENGDELVHRSQVSAPQGDPFGPGPWGVFYKNLVNDESISDSAWVELVNNSQGALRSALEAAIDSITQDDEPEPQDTPQNPEGTFIGVGFFDVPEDVRATVLAAANFFTDFVRTEVGNIANVVEQLNDKRGSAPFRRSM